MTLISINNKILPAKKATISVMSDGFQRGYGVFETLRTFKNKEILYEKQHIQRFFNGAKKIDLKIKYKKEQIQKMLTKIVKKSPHKIQRLKIIAIPEGVIITSEPLKIDKDLYIKGVSCKSIQCLRAIPEVKSISYLPSFLSHQKASKKGYYEAILIHKGEVYEGAYNNIFWFEKKILCTRKDQVLPGITAQELIKNSPYKVKYKKIKLKELIKKQEIFLTQSTKGILPIVKIDSHKINNGQPGEKTKKLMSIFSFL